MDAEEGLKIKVFGVMIVLFVGAVIYANVGGGAATRSGSNEMVSAQAPQPASLQGDATASIPEQSQPSQEKLGTPVVSSSSAPNLPRKMSVIPAWNDASAIKWRHKTSANTNWSLRKLRSNQEALLIDIGSNQVATVLVDPAFEKLDLPAMGYRVEYLKTEVTKISATSAIYVFLRSGQLNVYHGDN